ncbi:hypothetical protein HY837_03580 [archaeon]|nr:hypothetical protein [archaeon]
MKKVVLCLVIISLLLSVVFADYGFEVQQRDHGLRKNCNLGETTCFGFFFNVCQRDSSNNIMWNTVKKCTSTEICDTAQGCVENIFNNPEPVIIPEEKPDWAECTGMESKCSDDLTKVLGCKNFKWEERQICSDGALCLNKFGCIKKEEIKKEVTQENYDYLISLQPKPLPDEVVKEKPSNSITGNAVVELPKTPQVPIAVVQEIESLVDTARKILLSVIV